MSRRNSGPWNSQTGQLDRRTFLHKRYVIQRTVGRGGMGAVYMAKDMKRQGAICAIKEMSLSMVPPEEQAQAILNFKIEAKILWGLNHPNLSSFTGFFSENQRYFLVMEYIDGSTLEDLLERNGAPFSERRVLGWARQLCDVLEYLHSQSPPIIFRDMKPGNIMLTRSGHIKLIDFGIARFFRSTRAQDTQHLGTPGFAPPEQYGGAQTDVRSDIYSLGMTLFQLLTNTLSDKLFGLKDIRTVNPRISPVVARALEKAAAVEPSDRYNSVSEFRAALLGVGFVFDNGDLATTPPELADLCSRYPEEASDYLAAGEIEAWLSEIGEAKLARDTQRIRTQVDDPQEAVERFLQLVMGQNARIRSQASTSKGRQADRTGWFKFPASPLQVGPRSLDFGQVYPGISAPLSLTVNGNQGLIVSGSLHSSDSWIMLDQDRFDGMSTRINVRINSTWLLGAQHYMGTITITPDAEGEKKELKVSVEVEVLGYSTLSDRSKRRGKTVNADMDEDDDEDDSITMGATQAGQILQVASQQDQSSQLGHLAAAQTRTSEYKQKYGQPGLNGASSGWDPLQATSKQRIRIKRSLTFSVALMLASLIYTILAHLPALSQTPPLPPSPWFIIVIVGMVPLSTLGAILVNWSPSWSSEKVLNQVCTGMISSLLALSLTKSIWQALQLASLPPVQLLVMLIVAALGATAGIHPTVSGYIIEGVKQALSRLRIPTIITTCFAGAVLGYLLTMGTAFSWCTPIGIALGIAAASALVWHTDFLMKQNHP